MYDKSKIYSEFLNIKKQPGPGGPGWKRFCLGPLCIFTVILTVMRNGCELNNIVTPVDNMKKKKLVIKFNMVLFLLSF